MKMINGSASNRFCWYVREDIVRLIYSREKDKIYVIPCCAKYPREQFTDFIMSADEFIKDVWGNICKIYQSAHFQKVTGLYHGTCELLSSNRMLQGFSRLDCSRKHQQPRGIEICIEHNCNLNCVMCGYPRKMSKREKFLQAECQKQLRGKGLNYLSLTKEGEPFLDKRNIDYLLSLKLEDTKKVGIITNGTLLTEKDIDKIITHCDKEGIKIEFVVSIDGSDKEHYHKIRRSDKFDIAVNTARILYRRGKLLYINYVIQRSNLDELHNTVENFHQLGLPTPRYTLDFCDLKYLSSIKDINTFLDERYREDKYCMYNPEKWYMEHPEDRY